MFQTGGICECLEGNLLNGICNTIAGCIDPVLLPSGEVGCYSCNSSVFEETPQFGVCKCLNNATLINGICN